MNVERLLRVRDAIVSYPHDFGMESWVNPYPGDPESCGTALCVAGWAYLFAKEKASPNEIRGMAVLSRSDEVRAVARIFLDLSPEQALVLFYLPCWPLSPEEFMRWDHTSAADRAAIAARRIALFIAEGQ